MIVKTFVRRTTTGMKIMQPTWPEYRDFTNKLGSLLCRGLYRGLEGWEVRGLEGREVRGLEGREVRGLESRLVRGLGGRGVRGLEGREVL